MATPTLLEDLFNISENIYTTGSEWLDGVIIGLATLLFVRNAEFIVIDILTFIFGNRPHRVGFRVLRTWQMLTLNHFVRLVVGYDTDIPRSRYGKGTTLRSAVLPQVHRNVKKGGFKPWLFLFVFLGKLLVFGAEVAIIATVIPDGKVHRSEGGLGFRWRNVTMTRDSLSDLPGCLPLLSSRKLTDTAQVTLCNSVGLPEGVTPLPSKWIPNGSLRLEEVYLTREVAEKAGGVVSNDLVTCEGSVSAEPSGIARAYMNNTGRQVGIAEEPSAELSNDVGIAELGVSGLIIKNEEGNFLEGNGRIQPVFSDAEKTLRLTFSDFVIAKSYEIGGMAPLLNGRLIFGRQTRRVDTAVRNIEICRGFMDEILRVSGTLTPELMIDIIRSGIAPVIRESFSEPSGSFQSPNSDRGFRIGVSIRFRVPPEWMVVVAMITVVVSSLTSRLNKTEARMARVYREHNNMLSSCSPVFLEEEVAIDAGLFRKGEEYHCGTNLGGEWEEREGFDFSEKVILR